MKGVAKWKKCGGFGWLEVTQGHWQRCHSIECIDFLFVFNSDCIYLYRFRDIVSYLSKFANLNLSCLHLAPQLGATPFRFEFHQNIWNQKTRVPGLSCGIVCLILRLAIFVQHQLVTDRRTQTYTQCHSIQRATHSSRGKKNKTGSSSSFSFLL